jgi:hypothetical protein
MLTLVIEDPKSKADQALSNLIETCRSKATRQSYLKSLGYFMEFNGLPKDAYDRLA